MGAPVKVQIITASCHHREYGRRNTCAYLILAILSAALFACSPARPKPLAQPDVIVPQGDFVHAPSGMKFPQQVGEFERRAVLRKDTHGLDVSARYDLLSMAVSIIATIDAYPSPHLDAAEMPAEMVVLAQDNLSQQEFEVRRREILNAHPGAVVVQEGDTTLPQHNTPFMGRMAVIEYEDVFDRQRQLLRAQLHLFSYAAGEWSISYRFTYPRNADASQEIEHFMATLPWTMKRSRSSGSKK
jgi:hypothetical protein